MRESIKFWKDFLLDKRFSIRFKICNIIMGDYLREMIAFSKSNAEQIIENVSTYDEVPEAQAKLAVLKAKQINRWLKEDME